MSLYLVDGFAIVFRAYYAFIRQPLVNSKGEETGAVFGFLNTILNLINRYDPAYLAVVFDSVGKTFRHEMYPEYKANREETPETLLAQIPVVFALLDAMNIPRFSMEGFEADDLLATFSVKFEEQIPVKVVSGDKDLLQLVSENTHVIRPGKKNVLETEIDPERLLELMGVTAAQVVDYLALAGDSSDNVPGVRGVGPKTAVTLLQRYETLDNLYAALDAVEPPSLREKLRINKDNAFLSRELVKLKADVPVEVALGDFARGDMRTESLRALLDDLEFDRLGKDVFDGYTPPEKSPPGDRKPEYTLVDTKDKLTRLKKELAAAGELAVDVETSGLDPMQAELAGISFALGPGTAWYVPVSSKIGPAENSLVPAMSSPGLPLDVVRAQLAPVLAAEQPAKIGQNIKYDAIVLARAGMPLGGIGFDTMIASYCLDPARRSHGLDALALEFCGHHMIPFTSLFETRARVKDIRTVPLERVKEYACEDADFTLRLKHVFEPMLEASQAATLFTNVEMPLEEVLTRMEMTGVAVDAQFLHALSKRYGEEIGRIEERIYAAVGERFNINSTQKLRDILFNKLGLRPVRRTKTGFSTDVDVLTELSRHHEAPGLLLSYRQLVKLKSTYVDALPRLINPRTRRVHTSYNQAVTSTGRLSSSDPNLQNIPIRTAEGKEIRKAFVASGPDRVLLDADYSQIELRVLAHLSGDSELLSAFNQDADVHRTTAAKVMGIRPEEVSDEMRSRAKAVNFGIVYGQGARGLAQSLDIEVHDAKRFIDDYFRTYPGVKHFIDDTVARARREGYVSTLLGRIRQLPDIESSNGQRRAFSERIAVNTPVQGSAADIIKLAMLDIDAQIKERGLRGKMILQVHDELLFDVPEDELDVMIEVVRRCMEHAIELKVALKVDVGTGGNWLEAHR